MQGSWCPWGELQAEGYATIFFNNYGAVLRVHFKATALNRQNFVKSLEILICLTLCKVELWAVLIFLKKLLFFVSDQIAWQTVKLENSCTLSWTLALEPHPCMHLHVSLTLFLEVWISTGSVGIQKSYLMDKFADSLTLRHGKVYGFLFSFSLWVWFWEPPSRSCSSEQIDLSCPVLSTEHLPLFLESISCAFFMFFLTCYPCWSVIFAVSWRVSLCMGAVKRKNTEAWILEVERETYRREEEREERTSASGKFHVGRWSRVGEEDTSSHCRYSAPLSNTVAEMHLGGGRKFMWDCQSPWYMFQAVKWRANDFLGIEGHFRNLESQWCVFFDCNERQEEATSLSTMYKYSVCVAWLYNRAISASGILESISFFY